MRTATYPLRVLSFVTLSLVLLSASTATAQSKEIPDIGFARLEEAAKRIAAHVAAQMREQNKTSIIVGDFTAPPRLKTSGGAGVRKLVINAMEAEKITIRDDAQLQMIGRFKASNEEPRFDGEIGLKVEAELLDENDVIVDKFNITVFGAAALQITGGTAELSPKADAEERKKAQNQGLKKPQAFVVGNETRATANSLFGIEVHVLEGKKPVPRKPEIRFGRSFVRLEKAERYVTRLHNRSPHDAAVMLTIDGLSIFAFSTEGNFGSQVIVPAGKFVDVTGWYFAAKDTRAFRLTSYPDSAAGRKGIPTSSVGVITATFAATWKPDADPPTDEAGARSAETATGIGEPTGQGWKSVPSVIGRPRSVVSVRYNRDDG